MPTLLLIIIATFIISLISFLGVLTLFLKENLLKKILLGLVAFSAGALIGGSFLHLLPEAVHGLEGGEEGVFLIFIFLIVGFCLFYIIEQFIKWHHHHDARHDHVAPFSYLILVSDGFHNFIDGLLIAGSFTVSFEIGMISSLAVILHEIPQEIGDFAVLIYGGIKKAKALFLNFLSAVFAVVGGVAGYFIFHEFQGNIIYLLPFTAGGFIYIAASDLIPEIKEGSNFKRSFLHFIIFLGGISLMFLLKFFSHEG